MELIQAVILALIQGLTEFLPVSSSAHLILLPKFTAWSDQGLAFDVALNSGTTLAVIVYFRRDIRDLFRGFCSTLSKRNSFYPAHDGRLAWMLIICTLPVLLAGFFLHDAVSGSLRSIEVIAWSSIGWGLLLWVADRRPGLAEVPAIGWAMAIIIGISQAIAIVPGTSRSGITITAGLLCGLSRNAAARFSFLLSIPVGIMAGGYEAKKLLETGMDAPWLFVAIGFLIAFVSAILIIHFFLKFIRRSSMTPFVIYRVLLGVVLLLLF